ncbi:MAG: hypothetical protein MJ246_07465 [Clostridia bacterium]|nr:hypothetical protein [Clostridia bacterium]
MNQDMFGNDQLKIEDLYKEYEQKEELERKQELARKRELEKQRLEEEAIRQKEEDLKAISIEEEPTEEVKNISKTLNEVEVPQKKDKKPNSNALNLVTFKGTGKGIEIVLSDDSKVTFDEIYENLADRINATKEIFKDVRCGIVLKGRQLEKKEENKICTLLRRNMNISIDYINVGDFYNNFDVRKSKDKKVDYAETMYYHGTLRSGQSLVNNASIVIFGDVNPGSEVIAGGNLVVMGSLRGIVQAGTRSNDAYIVAFDMNPKQLRLGDYIARSADDGDDERIDKPHIAYIENDQICIEPIDGTFNLIEKDY